MATFRITAPDGSSYRIEGENEQGALAALQKHLEPLPPAPPGEVVHDVDRSTVTGSDVSVSTKGMKPEERLLAERALKGRAGMGPGRALAPVFQGGTMSGGDELVSGLYAGAKAITGGSGSLGENYNYAQEVQRQELEQARQEHPVLSTVGQIGGAVATAPAMGMVRVANAAAELPILGRVAAGMATGAGYGAVEGGLSGSGVQGRAEGAGVGAALGGIVGGVAPVVGEAVQRGARNVLDRQSVTGALQRVGLDPTAGRALMRSVGDDAASGRAAEAFLRAGPDAMAADASPAARSALDASMARGGPALTLGRQRVEERAAEAGRNLNTTLDRVLGGPAEGIEAATTAIREGSREGRRTAYDAAYEAAIDYSAPQARRLETLFERVPGAAVRQANELMQLGGHRSQQILADIADDGTVVFRQMPDVRQIDYLTRGLQQVARSGEGQGALGGQTPKGAAYEGLAREMRRITRALVPEYGQALDTAAHPIARIEALDVGRQVINPAVPRDVLASQVEGMSMAELQAARQGLRSAIDDNLAKVKAVASDPNVEVREVQEALRQMTSRAFREKAAMILPADNVQRLFSEIGRAASAMNVYASVARNSATAGRTATNEAIKSLNEPGAVRLAAEELRPVKAAREAWKGLIGRSPEQRLGQEDEVHRQIVDFMTAQNPQGRMDALGGAFRAAPENAARSVAIGAGASAGTLPAGYQAARQLLDLQRQYPQRR